LGPIAVTLADKSGASLPLISGALLGGSMFGDNLSMISDTTIAATQSLGCDLKDKFKINLLLHFRSSDYRNLIFLPRFKFRYRYC
jgi:Na+/H+ antiporter NhaC